MARWPLIRIRTLVLPHNLHHFYQLPRALTMDANSQRPKHRHRVLSSLNAAIDAMNIAKDVMNITPAKAVFASVSVMLGMIKVHFLLLYVCRFLVDGAQDSMINEADYVDLGLSCADVCLALDRGMSGKPVNELSQSVFEAIQQLAM